MIDAIRVRRHKLIALVFIELVELGALGRVINQPVFGSTGALILVELF